MLMIWQAYKARTTYLRKRKESDQRLKVLRTEAAQTNFGQQGRGQDQKQNPAEALVGSAHGQRVN
jgi:hypothetical protein